MTELVRKTVELPETAPKTNGKIAKPRKGRPATPQADAPVDLGDVNTQAEVDLTDVAIAAADVPFARATQVFDERYSQNLQAFGQHITKRQKATSGLLIDQIYGHFGLTEKDVYEGED